MDWFALQVQGLHAARRVCAPVRLRLAPAAPGLERLAAIIAGARTALEVRQHGGSPEAVKQLALALIGAGIVSGAVALVSQGVS